MVTNMYDEILHIDEFETETYEKKNRLQYWRNIYSNKEITTGMGIWNNKYYSHCRRTRLPKAPRANSNKPKKQQPKK